VRACACAHACARVCMCVCMCVRAADGVEWGRRSGEAPADTAAAHARLDLKRTPSPPGCGGCPWEPSRPPSRPLHAMKTQAQVAVHAGMRCHRRAGRQRACAQPHATSEHTLLHTRR
jgi:hypothetical protein